MVKDIWLKRYIGVIQAIISKMNSTVTSQIPNGRFLCSIQFAQNTFVRGCPNFTFFATIQKVLKNRVFFRSQLMISWFSSDTDEGGPKLSNRDVD